MPYHSHLPKTGDFATRAVAMGQCQQVFWCSEFGVEYDLIGCLDAPEWVHNYSGPWADVKPDRVDVLMHGITHRENAYS